MASIVNDFVLGTDTVTAEDVGIGSLIEEFVSAKTEDERLVFTELFDGALSEVELGNMLMESDMVLGETFVEPDETEMERVGSDMERDASDM